MPIRLKMLEPEKKILYDWFQHLKISSYSRVKRERNPNLLNRTEDDEGWVTDLSPEA